MKIKEEENFVEENIEETHFKTGENLICTLKQPGFTIYAFNSKKPGEIDVVVRGEPDQRSLCTEKIFHINGVIDCFSGNINKNKIIMPLIKELVKYGYSFSE